MTTAQTNGAPTQRKTLAAQLDRLDTILDALSDGLNEAVTTTVEQAVGTAVRGAVQAVLAELLTNPVVIARLRDALAPAAQPVPVAPATPAPPAPQPSRLKGHFERARAWAGGFADKARSAARAALDHVHAGTQKAKAAWLRAQPYRGPLLLSAGVGLACGVAGYFAGPWCAAGAAWVAGFATTLGVQAALACRRLLRFAPGS